MSTGRKKHYFIVAAVVTIALPTTSLAYTHVITQIDMSFSPAVIDVAPGDTVRWVWTSGFHTVTSGTNCSYDGLYFNVPLDPTHQTFEFVIPSGVSQIPYFCLPHCAFGMDGLIRVDQNATQFRITLDGDQEVPAVNTTGSGTGTATFLPTSSKLQWEISYSNLTGPVAAAHFHGPAHRCENAGVQVTLTTTNPIVGQTTLTTAQRTALLDGLLYVNLHTALFPAGEIRGWVMPLALQDPIPAPIEKGPIHIELEPVAVGLTAPNWGAAAPGDDDRLFVADQNGVLWAIDLATGIKTVFHNISGRLISLGIGGPGTYDERGFLGFAFHPNYASNGLLYTYTSEPNNGPADFSTIPIGRTANHQSVIIEWTVPNPTNPSSVVDPNSAREVLRIDQPQFNHNGGALSFGPDGMLYIALGDGGSADDHDARSNTANPVIGHGCIGNGQNLETVLGSILRIDPLGNNSANGRYGIPQDNPYVGSAGVDEIFASGFRNPFRLSFDSATGDLYVGDVGQNHIEEIDIVISGGNYGWNYKEGSFYFVTNGNQAGYATDMPLDVPAGLIDPIAEYDHDEGRAVVGGFVYRGSKIPALHGRYVFGEFASTFNNDGRLFYLDASNTIKEFELVGQSALGNALMGFGQDAAGELYVLGNANSTPFGTTGFVLRIRLLPGDFDADGDVDLSDLAALLGAYGQCVGDPGYQPALDLDDSGCIGLADLAEVLGNYTG